MLNDRSSIRVQSDGEHRPYPRTIFRRALMRVGAMLAIALDLLGLPAWG